MDSNKISNDYDVRGMASLNTLALAGSSKGGVFKNARNSKLHATMDIDPQSGFLAHFFKRDQDNNQGNPGRQYLNRALDKQKQFDKIFLQHIMAGEKERVQRVFGTASARGDRSSSVKTRGAALPRQE